MHSTVDPDIVHLAEHGRGAPVLVLHGGGGPASVARLPEQLADRRHVLAPTHPGWDATPRPGALGRVTDYAPLYLDLLAARGLTDVALVGSSLGGWIAMEMALRDTDGRVGSLALVDTVGIEVAGEPIADVLALDARGIVERSFHDPDRFFVDPATLPAPQARMQAGNRETIRIVAGHPYMRDPGLLGRLGDVDVPTLVLWGDSDGIVSPAYGRALAGAIPGARFELVPRAGHLPQLEQPGLTSAALRTFLG